MISSYKYIHTDNVSRILDGTSLLGLEVSYIHEPEVKLVSLQHFVAC